MKVLSILEANSHEIFM